MLIIKIFQTIAIEAFLRPYFSTFVQNHFISLLREVAMQVLHFDNSWYTLAQMEMQT